MKEIYCDICSEYRKFEKPKISYISEKALVFLLFVVSVKMNMKIYLKKKNQLRY